MIELGSSWLKKRVFSGVGVRGFQMGASQVVQSGQWCDEVEIVLSGVFSVCVRG
jgi:hypothetical protein